MGLKLIVDNGNKLKLVGYTEPDANQKERAIYSKFSSLEEHIESELSKHTSYWQRFMARFQPIEIGRFKPLGLHSDFTDYYLFLCQDCVRLRVSYYVGSREFICRVCILKS